jgi:predicted dehydrogenase
MVTADFGFRTSFNAEGRLFNPDNGGGALLDVGIYPLSFASMLLGTPTTIDARAHLGTTGVDEQSAYLFSYAGGQLALLSSATRTNTMHEARIYGTDGMIRIADWWHAQGLTLKVNGKPEEVIDLPLTGNGYNYEATEVGNCVRADKLESDVMPLDETLSIMGTLDAIRAQWGLKYPME